METLKIAAETAGQAPPQDLTIKARRLDRQVRGQEVVVRGCTVQPVARLSGWYDGDGNAQGGIAWGWVQLTPTEAIVRGGSGAERHIPIHDATAAAIRSMAFAALGIAVASWVVGTLVRRRRAPSGGRR